MLFIFWRLQTFWSDIFQAWRPTPYRKCLKRRVGDGGTPMGIGNPRSPDVWDKTRLLRWSCAYTHWRKQVLLGFNLKWDAVRMYSYMKLIKRTRNYMVINVFVTQIIGKLVIKKLHLSVQFQKTRKDIHGRRHPGFMLLVKEAIRTVNCSGTSGEMLQRNSGWNVPRQKWKNP